MVRQIKVFQLNAGVEKYPDVTGCFSEYSKESVLVEIVYLRTTPVCSTYFNTLLLKAESLGCPQSTTASSL